MDYFTTRLILSNTTRGKDYKNFSLVCKQWYAVINELFPGGDVFCNHLLTLLIKLPDADWNYSYLSYNPNMTLDYIKAHPEKPWDSRLNFTVDYMYEYYLHIHGKIIDFNIVMEHPELNWNYRFISAWPNINWKYVEDNLSFGWDHFELSGNYSLPWEFVVRNYTIHWDFEGLSEVIDIGIILQNLELLWDWPMVNTNDSVNWRNIWLIPEDKRDISNFCRFNENIMDGIEDYLDYVDFTELSCNNFITVDFIAKHINAPWNFKDLSRNPNITWDIVKANPGKLWHYHYLSQIRIPIDDFIKQNLWNYNLSSTWATLEYVKRAPNSNWNIWTIVQNSKLQDIDLDYIDSYHGQFSMNVNLTWRYIIDNMDKVKWNFSNLSCNSFGKYHN